MKKILILNCFGPQNRGDHELLGNFLKQLSLRYGPCSICGIANYVEGCIATFPHVNWMSRYGRKSHENLNRFYRLIFASKHYLTLLSIVCLPVTLRFTGKHTKKYLKEFVDADLIYSCPGGYLEDSGVAYLISSMYILLASKLKKSNAKLILAPMSVGPVQSNFGAYIVKKVLLNSDLVCLREKWSQNFCLSLVKDQKSATRFALLPDLAAFPCEDQLKPFSRKIDSNEFIKSLDFIKNCNDNNREVVGITLVNWAFPNLPNSKEYYQKAYINAMTEVVQTLIKENKSILIFNQVSSDLGLSRRLAEQLSCVFHSSSINSRIYLQEKETIPEELKALIGSCSAIIASRFHSAFFALQMKKPVVAISYLPKSSAILDLCNLDYFSIDIDKIDARAVLAKHYQSLANPEVFSGALSSYIQNCEDVDILFPQSSAV